jgi:branched-chain amino acid aminotransferase
VHVLAHGLHYGSSVFEGIRAYATPEGIKIFQLQAHLKRLYDSARIYRMELPYDQPTLTEACKEVLRASGLASAYLRPIAYRGFGPLGLVPRNNPVEVSISAMEWGTYLGEGALERGVDCCVSSWTRLAPNTMPTMAKAGGNYMSSQLIAMEAKRNKYDEAIALDINGFVSEGPGENIFLVKDGVLHTPPLTASILPGITRNAVITLARDLGLEVREENICREALYLADELFFTGTAAEVSPIRSVDGLVVGEGKRGPITARLQKAFFGLFNGETRDAWNWLEGIQ